MNKAAKEIESILCILWAEENERELYFAHQSM
jgi:hypothetical protein